MKQRKCYICFKRRLDKNMTADFVWLTKTGKYRCKYVCYDCEEENRGRRKRNS